MVGVVVGLESPLVDDHLMVEPAEGYEVFRVGWSALAPGDLVVGLESVGAGTSVGGADISVAVEDGPS